MLIILQAFATIHGNITKGKVCTTYSVFGLGHWMVRSIVRTWCLIWFASWDGLVHHHIVLCN
uniref:Uncharacterized protein n=1 Tax=Arundo donax TaxID=35708 RepID=A0A0A9BJ72_ARUDO